MVRWIGNEWRQARKQVRAVGDGASEHYLPELQQHWLVTVQRSPAYQQKGRRSSQGHLDHRGKQYWHVISSHNPLTQAQRTEGGRDSRASSEQKASEQKKKKNQQEKAVSKFPGKNVLQVQEPWWTREGFLSCFVSPLSSAWNEWKKTGQREKYGKGPEAELTLLATRNCRMTTDIMLMFYRVQTPLPRRQEYTRYEHVKIACKKRK